MIPLLTTLPLERFFTFFFSEAKRLIFCVETQTYCMKHMEKYITIMSLMVIKRVKYKSNITASTDLQKKLHFTRNYWVLVDNRSLTLAQHQLFFFQPNSKCSLLQSLFTHQIISMQIKLICSFSSYHNITFSQHYICKPYSNSVTKRDSSILPPNYLA